MEKLTSWDPLQPGYTYILSAPAGEGFDAHFLPELTPAEMLSLGVFSGNYFDGHIEEYPPEWFSGSKISEVADPDFNFFKVDASQPLSVWQAKGWIYPEDPRGWFQWYCRYYLGRRIPEEDQRQIKRWKAIRRHIGAIKKACRPGDLRCRPRQRQALLHWAYDGRKI
ncbi:MAG TPA: hypothetical protein VLA04_06240 [Verrucomicrobiae bacterium]|nr:hypothetical protein [Verrucomicrobiae bacterium]